MTDQVRNARHGSSRRVVPRSGRARHLVPVPVETADNGWPSASGFAVDAAGAGVRYGTNLALTDCSLRIPLGSVVAVVGQNGAGKSTLLQLLAGLQRPDSGSVMVLGEPAGPATSSLLTRVGFVGQDKPLYGGLRVSDLLRMGRRLNPGWDGRYAVDRLRGRGVPFDRKIGNLSSGQQTQVAMAMALAKRPDLLLLDEPLRDLDPVARREVMGTLMIDLAERNMTVVLSSHSLTDLGRVCDWLVLVEAGRVRLADSIDNLLAGHQLITGPVELADRLSVGCTVVSAHRGERQAILLVDSDGSRSWDPRWDVQQPTLEDLVFAYMGAGPG